MKAILQHCLRASTGYHSDQLVMRLLVFTIASKKLAYSVNSFIGSPYILQQPYQPAYTFVFAGLISIQCFPHGQCLLIIMEALVEITYPYIGTTYILW